MWMKQGIKVGLKFEKQAYEDLNATNPDCVEVWYGATPIGNDYSNLFKELRRRKIDVGLHFWGARDDGVSANISYPDHDLIDFSMKAIEETVDEACRNSFKYVNIHPGSRAKVKVDFVKAEFTLASDPVDFQTSQNIFLENSLILNDYAKKRGIVLTIETIPPRVPANWLKRETGEAIDIHELTVEVIVEAARRGLTVANDLEHTAANKIVDNPNEIYEFLREITVQIAPSTKLIHLGFLKPPYNGTDTHDSMEDAVFLTERAVPNREQMKELLKLFKNRDDIWLIPEPHNHHVENYAILKKMLEEI